MNRCWPGWGHLIKNINNRGKAKQASKSTIPQRRRFCPLFRPDLPCMGASFSGAFFRRPLWRAGSSFSEISLWTSSGKKRSSEIGSCCLSWSTIKYFFGSFSGSERSHQSSFPWGYMKYGFLDAATCQRNTPLWLFIFTNCHAYRMAASRRKRIRITFKQ